MPTTPPPVTPLPTPPSRADALNFAARGDAFLGALPALQIDLTALAQVTHNNAVEAVQSATAATTAASASAGSASNAANAAGAAVSAQSTASAAAAASQTSATNAASSAAAAASSASSAASSASAAAASAAAAVASVSPGFVMAWAGGSPPSGWLLCDGAAVSRTTYAALFSAIGTAFGTGDGSTTFNLPSFGPLVQDLDRLARYAIKV